MTFILDRDVALEIAKRNIPGHVNFNKFGVNPDIDMGSGFEDIHDAGGTYVQPTAARVHDIASNNIADVGVVRSSGSATSGSDFNIVDENATFISDGVQIGDMVVNDTKLEHGTVVGIASETQLNILVFRCERLGSAPLCEGIAAGDAYRVIGAASTGASVILIQGLSSTFTELSEYIVLNGTTDVPTTEEYLRVLRMEVLAADTAGTNTATGQITAVAQTDSTQSALILVGNNHTLMALATIPRGFTGFMTAWWAGLATQATASGRAEIIINEVNRPRRIQEPLILTSTGTTRDQRTYEVPKVIPEMSDIIIRADSTDNNVAVSAGFDVILVQNKLLR